MRCLSAYRGEEVTDEVIEAENRLRAQKTILKWCLGI